MEMERCKTGHSGNKTGHWKCETGHSGDKTAHSRSALLKRMLELDLIYPMKGKGKEKYLFKNM